jgi:Leucine-rich repeat (LRR) protein
LKNLDVSGTRTTNIAPLADLTALQELKLSDTMVRDLAPLSRLVALQSLEVARTPVVTCGRANALTFAFV